MRLSVLAVSAVLSPVLLAQARVPEVEPNGTPATAQAILIGDQIDCSLAAGEQDWFSFTLAAAGRIRIHTSGINTNADTRIALLNGTGTTYLAIDDDARTLAQSWSSEIQLNAAAGAYMVQVVGHDAPSAGLYLLEVASITPVVYDGFGVEPNETHLTATRTGPLGVGRKRFHGTLSPNTTVVTGAVVAAPMTAPVVFSGVCTAPVIMFSGAVAAAPASTILVTQTGTPLSSPAANPLLPSYTPGMNIVMTSGVNAGLARLIAFNEAFSVTSSAFPVASAPSDTFDIATANSTTVTWVGSLPLGSLYAAVSGYNLVMTSGPNAGLSRPISANTGPAPFGSAITTTAFPVPNAAGNTFDINCAASTRTVRVLGGLVPNVYNPTTGIAATGSLGHYHVRFTSGVNNGAYRQIAGNTGTSITLASALPAIPSGGDTFDIERVDADYYQIVLTAPNTGLWFQINEGDDNFVYCHRYELYDAAGSALLPAVSLSLPGFGLLQAEDASTFVPRTSSPRVWPAGTYYLAIRNRPTPFPGSATMPSGVVPSGNYMLEIFTMPMDTGGTISEAEALGVQANNTAATAEPFMPGQVIRGNVTASNGTDPSDWYGPIVISVPSTITYQTRRNAASPPPNRMLDSTVTLRDRNGDVVVVAGGGNFLDAPVPGISAGLHARSVASVYLTPGNYYIDVSAPGSTAFPLAQQFGDYELETSVLVPAPYVAASYATFDSNAGCGTAPQPVLTRFTTEVPATGTLFSRQLTSMTPSFIGLHVIGIAEIPPLDLAIVFGGTLGACFLNVSPDVIRTVSSDAAGTVELQLFIPGSLALRGTVLWEQGLDFDLSAPNGFNVQPGNYGRFIVGERTY